MSNDVITIGAGVHKLLKKTGAYDRLKNWLKRKNAYDILLVGASGTGKSAFLRSLQGLVPYIARDYRTNKVMSYQTKVGSSFFHFLDTPGERQHRGKREKAYKKAQKSYELGIINVVSYGYHEGLGKLTEAIHNGNPSKSFLEKRRSVEKRMPKEWTPLLLGEGGAANWMITVVTKADLWWGPHADQTVLEYYRSGDYFQALGPNAGSLPHSVHPFSSHDQLFYGVAPMSGYYDDEHRIQGQAAIINRLLENTDS